jgi:hypothetical protein
VAEQSVRAQRREQRGIVEDAPQGVGDATLVSEEGADLRGGRARERSDALDEGVAIAADGEREGVGIKTREGTNPDRLRRRPGRRSFRPAPPDVIFLLGKNLNYPFRGDREFVHAGMAGVREIPQIIGLAPMPTQVNTFRRFLTRVDEKVV